MNKAKRRNVGRSPQFGLATLSLITLVLAAAPVIALLYGSLRSGEPGDPRAAFTLANWSRVLSDPLYRTALIDTLLLATTVTVIAIALGATLAWIVARTDAPGRRQFAVLLVAPLMISTLITSLAWVAIAAPNAGFVNIAVRSIGGPRVFFNVYSFWGVALVLSLHYAAFAFVAIHAALRNIDASLEEAAYMSGAGPWLTARRLTLPLVTPAIAASALLIFVLATENFSVPVLLGTPTGFNTIASRIYFEMTGQPAQPTLGAAAGVLLLGIGVLGSTWQRRLSSRSSAFATIRGKSSAPRRTRLGGWRWAATAFASGYLCLAVALPYAMLVLGSFMRFLTPHITLASFTLANYARLIDRDTLAPIENSLLLSILGGLAGALAYVSIAWIFRRRSGPLARTVDTAVLLPTATPALALGVGFVWIFVASPIAIYGTIWALAIAFLVRFAGVGVRQSRAAFAQLSDELIEAARVSGASGIQVFRRIVLPLMRPAIASLWTLLFIMIFTEISITIMLYTPLSITLPVLLWDRMTSGLQPQAFAIAVAQATLVFVLLLLADRLFGVLGSTLAPGE